MKKLITLLTIAAIAGSAFAQTGLNARSMGMAGAYGALAKGSEVSRWNPANLGFPSATQIKRMAVEHPYWPVNPGMSFDIASVAVSLGNNSLNLDFYNEYFSKSYFDENEMWDDAAKDKIISNFDDDLRLFQNMQATELAVSYKQFAFAINTFAYTNLRVPQNLLTVPLQGLGTEPLPIEDAEGEFIAATEVAFSTSKVLYEWDYFDYFSLGATFKYFIGHAYVKLDQAEGSVLSNEEEIAVNGNYKTYVALPFNDQGQGGDGVGLDLGAAAIVGENLVLGLTFSNLIGSINFGEIEETHGSIALNEPGINIDELTDLGDYIDSVAVTTDTTYISADIIRYKLPKSLTFSASYQFYPWLLVAADYQQGLNHTAGGTTIPRLALGAEFSKVKILPLRLGLALGGIQGTTIAAGFGLNLGAFQLDFAMAGQRGLFNGSKGVNFAISPRLTF